jgi:hypothetical protein
VALIADEVGYDWRSASQSIAFPRPGTKCSQGGNVSFPVRELFIPSLGIFRELTATIKRAVFSKPTRILLVNDHQEQKKFPLMRIFFTINSSNC